MPRRSFPISLSLTFHNTVILTLVRQRYNSVSAIDSPWQRQTAWRIACVSTTRIPKTTLRPRSSIRLSRRAVCLRQRTAFDVRSPRVVTLHERQRRRILQAVSITNPCDIVRRNTINAKALRSLLPRIWIIIHNSHLRLALSFAILNCYSSNLTWNFNSNVCFVRHALL